MSRAVRAQIDPGALRHNLERVRAAAPGSRIMAAVKANGYGHGAVTVAKALEQQADGFAVACLDEAVELRDAGIRSPITLLGGVMEAAEMRELGKVDAEVVVHDRHQLELMLNTRDTSRLQPIWIKVDSGMHRLGFLPREIPEVYQRIREAGHLQLRGWLTHLARADEPDGSPTREQIETFHRAVDGLPGLRSIANSAGILAWPDCHADVVRPGIMLYGASPLIGRDAKPLGLQPAMTLTAPLLSVHDLPAGSPVGYGGTYRCPEDMTVGVVAIGYGDGYPRSLPNGTPVVVNGQRATLAGRISMDLVTLDLRGHPQARPGDSVVLWGDGLPADEIARVAGTIPYELFCQLTPRVRRVVQTEG